MAERVDKIPRAKGGPGAAYPWDEWLDGSLWELIQGKDFECKPNSMSRGAKEAGLTRGVAVTVAIRGDRVYVQALLNGQGGQR